MYVRNRVIDLSKQNKRANSYFKYMNNIIPLITAKEDIISLISAKQIMDSLPPFIYNNLTRYMTEINAIRMVQLSLNMGVVAWQWVFTPTSTWFSYFITSPSGLFKIYQCIFENPIYGLLFFSSFYFKLLKGTFDEEKFNRVAKILNIPKHADMGVDSTLTRIVENVPSTILGYNVRGYRNVTKKLLKLITSGVMAFGIQTSIQNLLISSLKQVNTEISNISKPAVYISDRDRFDFDDNDIQEQLKFIKKEQTNIKKYIKKHTNPKNKKYKKRIFLEIAQVKAPSGHVICLNKCKSRVKTQMGCYCEGDCGTTTFLGGKKWCWVDPEKCKKGKYLEKYRGYAYDRCDNKNLTKSKKCFTGKQYTDCKTV